MDPALLTVVSKQALKGVQTQIQDVQGCVQCRWQPLAAVTCQKYKNPLADHGSQGFGGSCCKSEQLISVSNCLSSASQNSLCMCGC
jgi:hypothetical protein